jgi:hypothetical protein
MTSLRKLDGRWLTALIVLGYFGALILGHLVLHRPISTIWRRYQVPAFTMSFLDLRTVVVGTGAVHAGKDPWEPNTLDPLHRPFNYPRWWLYADYIGLNEKTLNGFGIGMGLLFFLCALYVLGRLTITEGLLAALLLVSTSVMLGVERGNIDLAIFSVLTLALAFRRLVPIHCLLISLAAILKIYPAFGLLTLVNKNWRKTLFWLAASAGMLLVYFILNLQELHRIAATTPHTWQLSYGSSAAILAFYELYLHAGTLSLDYKILALGNLIMIGVIAVAVWKRPRIGTQISWSDCEKELCSFRLGAGVYVGTFALGTNYDYRVLFLTFCLPLLFRLIREKNRAQPWATTTLILTLVYANGLLLLGSPECVLKEVLAWGLVFTLTGLLSSALFQEHHQLIEAAQVLKNLSPMGDIQRTSER